MGQQGWAQQPPSPSEGEKQLLSVGGGAQPRHSASAPTPVVSPCKMTWWGQQICVPPGLCSDAPLLLQQRHQYLTGWSCNSPAQLSAVPSLVGLQAGLLNGDILPVGPHSARNCSAARAEPRTLCPGTENEHRAVSRHLQTFSQRDQAGHSSLDVGTMRDVFFTPPDPTCGRAAGKGAAASTERPDLFAGGGHREEELPSCSLPP